jgi:hypothetical protein
MGFQIVDCGLKICDHWEMTRPAGMADDNKPSGQLHPLLQSIAAQLMNGTEVVIKEANGDEQRLKVTRIGSGRLRTVRVRINGREIQAIEQNRSKPSRWGELARKGHQAVQFQDVVTRKYLAVAVDGEVLEYGR